VIEQTTTTFEDLGLSDALLNAVRDAGYERPTPIQEKSIPLVLMGRDLLGCAQTGTGKTASFSLPIIDILSGGRARARMPRALVLSPTRELAQQISENFTIYNKYQQLGQAVLIGGESMPDQERALAKDPDVVIATPGRLIDMFERGKIMLGGVKILVIDEADRMLDMGFIPDVRRIVELLPRIRQTLFFSATMGPEIRALADDFLINPKEVSVAPPASIATGVTHSMISVPKFPKDKRAALRKVMANEDVQSALVFCNRKKDITILRNSLRRHGFEAEELHGDMPQHRRTETLAAYKAGEIKLLVCSDVAGRGLDIQGVSHVFNFDVPNNAESYVHRIGRTGRAGRKGRAITLVTS
jgi:superfamily II DNA/RNA helicase